MEQEDIRMTKAGVFFPPFAPKRQKIGFLVIEMSKQQDTVTHFEAKRLIKLMKPAEVRHQSTFFNAPNGKFCIIPFTGTKGEACNFSLTVQFQTGEKYIKLSKTHGHSKNCVMTQIPSTTDIEKWKKMTSLMASIKLPYNIDFYINKRDTKPNKNKESISENVRVLLLSDAVFEDEACGMNANAGISSEDLAEMDEETIQQMILGVDLDNIEEEEDEKKQMSEL